MEIVPEVPRLGAAQPAEVVKSKICREAHLDIGPQKLLRERRSRSWGFWIHLFPFL